MHITTLSSLLHKPMDRKQFLRTIGFVLLAIFGFGALVKTMGHASQSTHAGKNDAYGDGEEVHK